MTYNVISCTHNIYIELTKKIKSKCINNYHEISVYINYMCWSTSEIFRYTFCGFHGDGYLDCNLPGCDAVVL